MSKKEFKVKEHSIKKHLSSKFVKVDEISKIFSIGFNTGKNIFLYGRGGHGKSEMTEALSEVIPGDWFFQSCGPGLTTEKIFGGIDLKKFNDTGELEYLVENSFMNQEYVVFEELLDAPIHILLDLKDILTSGKFRQGSQTFDIKTKMVICCTNRTREEVSEDDSIKALMERFPLELKVEWDSYKSSDYSQMFSKVLGKDMSHLAEIVADVTKSGSFISPRTAIHIAKVYETAGMEGLKFIAGIDEHMIEQLMEKEALLRELAKKRERILDIKDGLRKMALLESEAIDDQIRCVGASKYIIERLDKMRVHDEFVKEVRDLAQSYRDMNDHIMTTLLETYKPDGELLAQIAKLI